MTTCITDYVSKDDLIRWTQRFVRYPSPQTDLFEADPSVLGFITDCIIPVVEKLGVPYRLDRMGNLISEIGTRSSSNSILLMAYAMTHPAANMPHPFDGELIETDTGPAIRGRGISEQKGALVAALAAAYAAAVGGGLNGRLVFTVSTAGETGRHDAAEAIVGDLDAIPRLGVVVIGTGRQVALANKGRLDVKLSLYGKACHSSSPWMGTDAIRCAQEVLTLLDGLDLGETFHPELGKATLTPTAIRSFPEATHTVQSEVHLVYDRRLLPGQNPDEAFMQIQDALRNFGPCRVEIGKGPFMYPNQIDREGRLVRTIQQGCRHAGLEAPRFFCSHGCLDAGFLSLKGCESTMWGPGEITEWHSDNEIMRVEDLIQGATAYLGFIRAALATPSGQP